jgi:hypothetical protein
MSKAGWQIADYLMPLFGVAVMTARIALPPEAKYIVRNQIA